jgi:hypothetical protein
VSIFWRSAAHRWKTIGGVDPNIELGPYLEPLRSFLRDEASFPANTVLDVFVWPVDTLHVAIVPHRLPGIGTHHEFRFYVPGLEFR